MRATKMVGYRVLVTLSPIDEPKWVHTIRLHGSLELKREPRSPKRLLELVEGHLRVTRLCEWAAIVRTLRNRLQEDITMTVEAV